MTRLFMLRDLYTEVPIRGTDFKAKYATETRSPEDFKGKSPLLKDINFFLESFGQTNREYSERTNEGDITQAILLMNSPFVLRQMKAAPGQLTSQRLLQETIPNEEKIVRLVRTVSGTPAEPGGTGGGQELCGEARSARRVGRTCSGCWSTKWNSCTISEVLAWPI